MDGRSELRAGVGAFWQDGPTPNEQTNPERMAEADPWLSSRQSK